jgi:hypothetical protein
MAKTVTTVVIVIMLCLIAYLVIEHNQKTTAFENRIAELEAKIQQIKDDCESKIAALQEENEKLSKEAEAARPSEGFAQMIKNLVESRKKAWDGKVAEVARALDLNEDQQSQFKLILEDFRQQKGDVYKKGQEQGIFPFDNRISGLMKELQEETLKKLKTVLTDDQYRRMVELNYDQHLGLRSS